MLKFRSPDSVTVKLDLSSTLICKSVMKHAIEFPTKMINLCGTIFLLFTCWCGVRSYCCKGSEQVLVIFVCQLSQQCGLSFSPNTWYEQLLCGNK